MISEPHPQPLDRAAVVELITGHANQIAERIRDLLPDALSHEIAQAETARLGECLAKLRDGQNDLGALAKSMGA